jgi:hypothetical protein
MVNFQHLITFTICVLDCSSKSVAVVRSTGKYAMRAWTIRVMKVKHLETKSWVFFVHGISHARLVGPAGIPRKGVPRDTSASVIHE